MKPFPFTLGTDIVRSVRFHPLAGRGNTFRIARRILHENEFARAWVLHNQALATFDKYLKTPQVDEDYGRTIYDWLTTPVPPPSDQEASEQPSTPYELRYEQSANAAGTWLAGRWAAKEAARKAWGANLIGWKDVRVEYAEGNISTVKGTKAVKIVCQPHHQEGDRFEETSAELDLQQEGLLSISHDGAYVVATVIAEPLDTQLLEVFRKRAKVLAALEASRREQHDDFKAQRAVYDLVKQKVSYTPRVSSNQEAQ